MTMISSPAVAAIEDRLRASLPTDVDYASIKAYPGNYQAFIHAKRDDRERREKEIAKREAKIAEQKAFVERFRAKATKARQAQSKLKSIDRIEIETLPESSRRYPRFRFEQCRPSGRQVRAPMPWFSATANMTFSSTVRPRKSWLT